jgi:hypothetical protein
MQFSHIVRVWFCFGIFLPATRGRLQGLKRERLYDEQFMSSVNDNLSFFRARFQEEEEYIPVIIGFAPDGDGIRDIIVNRLSQFVKRRFQRFNAISALVKKSQLLDLQQNPDILYIDEDVLVYSDESDDGEPLLYGLEMIQAFNPFIPSFNSSAACNDLNSFKVGIVDSGMAV